MKTQTEERPWEKREPRRHPTQSLTLPLQQGRPQSSSSQLQNSTEPLGDSRFHPPFLMVHSLGQAMPLDTQASVWIDDTPRVRLDPQLWCLFFLPTKNLETVSPHSFPKVD